MPKTSHISGEQFIMEKDSDRERVTSLVKRRDDIKLAFIGKVADDDHPYSWSAILNGYEENFLAICPNQVIRDYLKAVPRNRFCLPGVSVTHIWCDDAEDARRVAKMSRIPHVAASPEEVIGEVDAVVIPTDLGSEHLERARPFLEAGIPVFIDKPLTISANHLAKFVRWHEEGRPFMSSSCMRYAAEFISCRPRLEELGDLRFITSITCRSWERYGIHALEALCTFLPVDGWESVTTTGTEGAMIVHLRHKANVRGVIAAMDDMDGAFGCVSLYGTRSSLHTQFRDSFSAFKAQLADFVLYLRSGRNSYSFTETIALMKIIIAGIRSRAEGGRMVELSEITLR
jgi:predicted dehydrogenase